MKIFVLFLLGFFLSAEATESGPDWVEDAVFYQIFPERFRNGDPANDPDVGSLYASYPHDTSSAWQVSPWNSDWYKLQPWEEENGKGFFFNAQRRRYGGDIQGIIDKLDYLSELGINAIYLNPVFESPSLHKYDAETYIHIDNNFGPNPVLDRQIMNIENPADPLTWKWTSADSLFLQLIQKAHHQNIKIIIDGVFNHVGLRFWAFQDVQKNGPDSYFKDWFIIRSWDDPKTEKNEFDYAGWVGVRELPELTEDENGLIKPVKQHIFDVVKRWMDPNGDGDPEDGIDGWRLDVAEMVHHNFWKDFRQQVKSINPNAYITGEIFWDDWQNNKLMNPEPWLKGDQFDGVMNYRWSAALTNYFIDKKTKITPTELKQTLIGQDKSYSRSTRFQLLNLMDSHDTDRLASNVKNPDRFYDKRVGLQDDSTYDVSKPGIEEWKMVKLVTLFQFASPGPPMIYYGGEAGMWGGDDPDERKPMVWDDISYEPEISHPFKTRQVADEVSVNQEIFQYYKQLIHLRNNEPALRRGKLAWLVADDNKDVIAFSRKINQQEIILIINNSVQKQEINISGLTPGIWRDLLSGVQIKIIDKKPTISLDYKSGLLLKKTD